MRDAAVTVRINIWVKVSEDQLLEPFYYRCWNNWETSVTHQKLATDDLKSTEYSDSEHCSSRVQSNSSVVDGAVTQDPTAAVDFGTTKEGFTTSLGVIPADVISADSEPVPRSPHFHLSAEPSNRFHCGPEWRACEETALTDGRLHIRAKGLQRVDRWTGDTSVGKWACHLTVQRWDQEDSQRDCASAWDWYGWI